MRSPTEPTQESVVDRVPAGVGESVDSGSASKGGVDSPFSSMQFPVVPIAPIILLGSEDAEFCGPDGC